MRTDQKKAGFTLIELLVVVLIIGILAGVALPQYNKAVRKARLSEVATTFNAASKGIDVWLEENDGYPESYTWFSRSNTDEELDIGLSCVSEEGHFCYVKLGRWSSYCTNGMCDVQINTSYNADKTTGNTWLDGSIFQFRRWYNGPWGLNVENISSSAKSDVCRWWRDLYGNGRVIDPLGNASTACDAYF